MTLPTSGPTLGLVLLLVLASFAAFVRPVQAQEGLRTAEQRGMRTRYYPGETVRHVMEEAAKVFELAQAGYHIVYGKHGVIAHREWGWETALDETVDLGVGGAAYWYVSLTQEGEGVVVRSRVLPEPDAFTPLDPAEHENRPGELIDPGTIDPATFDTAPLQPEEARSGDALLATFFNRLDVLLGQNRYWLYCRAAKEYAIMEGYSGSLDGFCMEAGDLRPGARLP